MTWEIGLLFVLLGGMAFFFFTEKLPVDLTAFIGLSVLILAGFVTPKEAFLGFSSSAVITMLAIFFVSGAMLHTGLADIVGARIHKTVGNQEVPLIIALMLVAGVLSAFMNNVAATAVLLPAVASLAKKAKVPPSRLFMPLSFGAILGGTTTLVGTPPNILAAEMLETAGYRPFSLFEFTPIGLVILGTGVLFMITLGRKLLPDKKVSEDSEFGDLARVYKLQERLTSMRIPANSSLDGQTLREAKIGSVLGIQVVGITRGDHKKLAPKPDDILKAGDILVVKGHSGDLQDLLNMANVKIAKTEDHHFKMASKNIRLVNGYVTANSSLIGQTLREMDFRHRYHMFTVGIIRNGTMIMREIVSEPLCEGDQLLMAMPITRKLSGIDTLGDIELHKITRETLTFFRKHVFVLTVHEDSTMIGVPLGKSRIGEFLDLSVVGVTRGEVMEIEMGPEYRIEAGDQIFVTGEVERVQNLLSMGKVRFGEDVHHTDIQSEEVGVIEATLAPRSNAVGRTLAQLNFREKFDLHVLAIWHDGRPRHRSLADIPLRTGDALLLQGTWDRINIFGSDRNFVTLSASVQEPRRTHKAPMALGALMLMIGLVVSGFQPIHVAAFVAATAVVLSGAITMEEAYLSVEWRAIFLVAAILPVGSAMERTGAASLISQLVIEHAGPLGPYAILAGLFVLASFLSQCLDGAPAVVLLTPVALQTAKQMGMSPYPIMMGISLAASAAFMTPFSHKANLLVMGAGGYKVTDYLKVGTPLTIVLLIIMVIMVPMFFPIELETAAQAISISAAEWPMKSVTELLRP